VVAELSVGPELKGALSEPGNWSIGMGKTIAWMDRLY